MTAGLDERSRNVAENRQVVKMIPLRPLPICFSGKETAGNALFRTEAAFAAQTLGTSLGFDERSRNVTDNRQLAKMTRTQRGDL